MQDTEKLHDFQFRSVLKRLSPVLKKHAEILAFFESKKFEAEKKPRCVAHRGSKQDKNDGKKCNQPQPIAKI